MILVRAILVVLLVVGVLAMACESGGPAAPVPPNDRDYVAGQVLIRLVPGASIEAIHARYRTRTIEAIESERVYLIDLPAGVTVEDIASVLSRDPDLEAVSPNSEISIPEAQGRSTMSFADAGLDRSDYADQRALGRIRAPQAWEISRGGSVLVAVLDTGVDPSHPDVAGRVVAGVDLIDDDGDASDRQDDIDSDQDGLIDEAFGHGTFVAGLVLSVAPDARILPVRILDSDGIGTAMDVARGIKIAVDRGARVVNMSFGMAIESEVITELIEQASDQRGLVFVGSAGNAGTSTRQYPAAGSEVLAVAAVDSVDAKADFSNHGSWVRVAAPGVGLVGPMPPDRYSRWSGTSFATALTSGEAAVIVAYQPAARSDDIRAVITTSAVQVADPRLEGARRIDVRAALESLGGAPAGGGEGQGGDGTDIDDGDDPGAEDEPGNETGGDEDPGDDSSNEDSNDVVVLNAVVVSVDLVERAVMLEGGARVRVPDDGAITQGNLTSLAAVSSALNGGVVVRAHTKVVSEAEGLRALEINFHVIPRANHPEDHPEPDPVFVVSGIVASIDLAAKAAVLTTGERIVVAADALIERDSDLVSLSAVSTALALGAEVWAEATVVEAAGVLRARRIHFGVASVGG